MSSLFSANPDDLQSYFAQLQAAQPQAEAAPAQPASGGGGLLGMLQGLGQRLTGTGSDGSTFKDRLSEAAGDLSPADAYKIAQDRKTQAADATQRQQDASDASSLFPGDDAQSRTARLMYASGNPEFRKALASHFETRVSAGGSTITDPLFGGDRVTAKLNDDGGSQTTQTANSVTQTGQAAPSFSAITDRKRVDNPVVAAGSSVPTLNDTDPTMAGQLGVSGYGPINPATAPQTNSVAPNQGASGAATGASMGDRGNNPGNIRPPPSGTWQGQTGVNSAGYATFDTPQNGARAMDLNLQAYARHGITTPQALVSRWASTSPPGEQAAYAARIQAAAGPQFDLSDPATRAKIAPAIAASEGTHLGGAPQSGRPGAPALQHAGAAPTFYSAPAKPDDGLQTVTGDAAQKLGLDPQHVYNAKTGADITPGGGAGQLDEGAKEQIAQGVAQGGALPNLGYGKTAAANKIAILNRVAQIQGTQGLSGGEAAARVQDFKASSHALSGVQARLSVMEPAAQATLQTLDKAIDFAKHTGAAASGLPLISGMMQSARVDQLHQNAPTQYRNYLGTAASEYAKVIAAQTGGAATPEGSMKEARTRLNEGMSLSQLMSVRNAMADEMRIKTQTMQGERDALASRMSGKPTRQQANQQLKATSASKPPRILNFNPATGAIE